MNNQIVSKENELNEALKKLVVARINANMSSTLKLSIGSTGSLSKDQMIEHVMGGDSVGKRIMQTHLNFMKAQATGQLMTALNTV